MRDWLDIHPKVAGAILTFLALIALVWIMQTVIGVDLGADFGEWFLGALPVIFAAYMVPSDKPKT